MLCAFHRQKSMHIGCISLLEVPIPLLEHVSGQRLLTWYTDVSFIMNHSCAVFMPYLTCYLTSLFVKLYMASFVSVELIYFFDLCFSFSSSVFLLCNCWSRSAVNMECFWEALFLCWVCCCNLRSFLDRLLFSFHAVLIFGGNYSKIVFFGFVERKKKLWIFNIVRVAIK